MSETGGFVTSGILTHIIGMLANTAFVSSWVSDMEMRRTRKQSGLCHTGVYAGL